MIGKMGEVRLRNIWKNEAKEYIEEVFGGELEWQRLDNKRAARIRKTYDYANLNDVKKWDKLQEDMINGMIRLENVLKKFINKV